MDPSAWMDPYGHLRVPTRHHAGAANGGVDGAQLNSCSHQMSNHNRNLQHHMTAAAAAAALQNNHCHQKNPTTATTTGNHQSVGNKSHHKQPASATPNPHFPTNHVNHHQATGQTFMNGHYRTPNTGSSWLHHTNHENSLHLKNHSENGNISSYGSNPFSLPPHSGMYDPNFMSAASSFAQTTKSNGYLSSMASDLVDQMTKNDTNIGNYRTGAYCPTTGKSFNMNDTCNNVRRDANMSAGGFFPSSMATTNGWHQNHFMPSNVSAPSGHNGMFHQHDQHVNNMMNACQNSGVPETPRNHTSSRSCSINSSVDCMSNPLNGGMCNNTSKAPSSNVAKSHSKAVTSGGMENHHQQAIPNHMAHGNLCQPYKNAAAMNSTFPNMPLNSNNPYLMQNLPVNRNSQNSFVDPTFSAKFAAAAAHHDPYAFFAAAQAEYAFQQSNSHKHCQYVSSMNHQYSPNSNRQAPEYAPVGPNFKTNRQNDFINYCSASFFPVTHPEVPSMNPAAAAFKSHNAFLEDYPSIPEIVPQQQPVPPPVKSSKARKNAQKAKTASQPPPPPLVNGISFNEYATNCPPNGGNCCLASNNNSVSNNHCPPMTNSHHSVAQPQQPNNSNDPASYSYNYPSPITTNLSVHSPYQQRSMSSGSSHSSVNSCALSSNGAPDYMNYGTPNSAPPTVFPTMATSQTPTPTPGYPTPPSSVGHSNSRGTSNEELSPYSNNSMSSNISHQSYGGRNDFKSNSSSSSQISPKQVNEVNMSESLQFNSCMVASQNNSINGGTSAAASTLQQSSPSLYPSNVIQDTSSYKSPPYYSNHMSNGALSNDSTETYSSYVPPKDSAPQMHQMASSQESIKIQVPPTTVEPDSTSIQITASNSFDYNFSQSQSENSFHGHAGYVAEKELSSCSKESDSQRSSSHLIPPQLSENDKNGDYRHNGGPNLATSDEDQFNLNFESVIQPIEVDMGGSAPTSQSNVVQQPPPSQADMEDPLATEIPMQLEELDGQKAASFQPIDDLNFISEQDQDDKVVGNYSATTVDQNDHPNSQPLNGPCDQIAYEPSHETGSLMGDEPATMDACNNIDSLIHSLPNKPGNECLTTEKNSDAELLPGSTTSDIFLPDLAPLMNDSSKIALMESTFKSNQPMESVEHPSVIADKLHKTIFDDISKIDNQLTFSKSADDDDNHFRDVDEFLKSNYKESPENEPTLNDIKNELNDTVCNGVAASSTASASGKEDSTIQTPDIIALSSENRKSDDLRKSTKKSLKASAATNDKKTSTVSSLKRKAKETKLDTTSSTKKAKKSKPNNINNSGSSIIKNVAEYEFKETSGKPIKPKASKKTDQSPTVDSNSSHINKSNKKACLVSNLSSPIKELPVVNTVFKKDNRGSPKTNDLKTIASKKPGEKGGSSTAKKTSSKPNNLKPVVKIEKKTPAPILPLVTVSKSELKETPLKSVNKPIAPKLKKDPIPGDQSKEMPKNVSFSKNEEISTKKSKIETKKSKSNAEKKPVSDSKRIKSVPIVATSSANPQLLSPNLITNGPCLNKSVNPTITNVTPTLIVNQGHSVNPYQVSPMTNAVLISIHPANPTPIPSLTAQSFITLATQSVTSTTNSNTTTTTSGSSQNASRRRSQDKKVSTIREGLMRTGDFVVAEEEAHLELPVIWRIEGKSLLQRFEPSEQNGITIYSNTSSYSAWNPTVRQKYLGLDVRIMGCNRTRIVVEKIGLTQSKSDIRETSSLDEKESAALPADSSPANIFDNLENFEVLIQTLISQALDSNFIAEIVKEKDEYFLSCMQIIEDFCHKRRSRLIAKIKWDNGMLKNFETYPTIQIHKQNNVGDLRCRSCNDNWSTKILYFEGEPYNRDTLEKLAKETENKKVKIAACDSCAEKIFLYSKLYHYRYNFFLCCKSKVDDIQSKDSNKESHVILDECLQDSDWIKKMFQELENILLSCDALC